MATINAVVLFNGTSNDDKDQALTNVVKMRDGLVQDKSQIVIYRDGVGNDQQWGWATRWFSLLTGYGAGWVMDQAYVELRKEIDAKLARKELGPEDTLNVSLGGFSRGASIARHFGNDYIINRLYQDYEKKFNIILDAEYLFDSVGAFGIPFNIAFLERLKIYTQEIDWGWNFFVPILTKAYHAISLDEKREGYTPKPLNHRGVESRLHAVHEDVYFAGDHSTVGGGHHKPRRSSKLADRHPLHYMSKRAMENGLRFNYDFVKAHKLEDKTKQYVLGKIFETDTTYWPSTQVEDRELLTEIDGEKKSVSVPKVHTSLYRRMKEADGYRPSNLAKIKEVDVLKEDGTVKHRSLDRFKAGA